MNILFYSRFGADENSGGVQHVTYRLAESFNEQFGYGCYLSQEPSNKSFDEKIFRGVFYIDQNTKASNVRDFISAHRIDVVIIQSSYSKVELFRSAIGNGATKIIFCFHGEPGFELLTRTFENDMNSIRYSSGMSKLKSIAHLLLRPFERYKLRMKIKRNYSSVIFNSDKVVLLSQKSIARFCHFASYNNVSGKVVYINNPNSYDFEILESTIRNKKNRVLIVARFEEFTKKISLALHAWTILEKKYNLNDWELDVVGDGDAFYMYRTLATNNDLKRVIFHGFQKPENYFCDSSIFLLPSLCEGWPLSLVESMQYGCVPVVFDSFSSQSDIVTDGFNGFVVKYHDVESYARKIYQLMNECDLRMSMGKNASESIKKYSVDKISSMWFSLLNSLS